ncbi:MAG: inositol 2-dehydrogenase [Flavobacteriaceae bacterium]|nr:inositol 2-dehydrogenase [Flavobacteriaceae bacterium]
MKKLKIGVAGLGRIGKIHLNNLLQLNNVEVIGVTDPAPEALEYSIDKGVKNTYETFNDLVTVDRLDAVVISTPTHTHANYVETSARLGKHIFCEKPLDLNIQRVKDVLKVVDKSKVKLMIGFNRRFDNEFRKVKDSINNGEIGDPHVVKITSRDPSPPPLDYIKNSGGIFLDMTIHDFDMARFIVDKEIDEIYVKGEALIDEKIKKEGDIDTAVIIMKYVDSSMAVIDNSRKAVYGYDQRIEVFGSKGMIQANNVKVDNSKLYNQNGTISSLPMDFFLERYMEAYKIEIKHFVDSVTKGIPISVSGNDGLKSLQIGLAAKKSLAENRPVKINEIE